MNFVDQGLTLKRLGGGGGGESTLAVSRNNFAIFSSFFSSAHRAFATFFLSSLAQLLTLIS